MGGPDDKASSENYKEFDRRLKRAVQKNRKPDTGQARGTALGIAFRIATDLVAAIGVGVGIGWLLDSWLETRPLFLVVFFFVGAAAGLLNVIRLAKSLDAADKETAGKDTGTQG